MRAVLQAMASFWDSAGNNPWLIGMFLIHNLIPQIHAEEPTTATPPAFKQLRYDEDYSYLQDPARRVDWLDPIKFIPFNTNGTSLLRLLVRMERPS